MSEQERQYGASEGTGREASAVADDHLPAEWEGYSPDTLAALLDP